MKMLFSFLISILLIAPLQASAAVQELPVSIDASYEYITKTSTAYPDDANEKLTNGKYASLNGEFYYTHEAYVGFNRASLNEDDEVVIILDLGAVYDDLSDFRISYLNEIDTGIYSPESFTVYLSETVDGDYVKAGTSAIEPNTANGAVSADTATLSVAEGTKARYVRFNIKSIGTFINGNGTEITAGWIFLDEISVYTLKDDSADSSDEVPPTGDNSYFAFSILFIAVLASWAGIYIYRAIKTFKKRNNF